MKRFSVLFLLLIVSVSINAQSRWIEDAEMKFKISVPSNYQANQFLEGSDKIYAFLSPDQNVAVRIRSFKVSDNTTINDVINAFSQSIITGASQLTSEPYTLNGTKGQAVGYSWRYNNVSVVVLVFYTIYSGTAYVVWSLVPENLFSKRSAETDAITNSFTILKDSGITNTKPIENKTESIASYPVSDFIPIISDDACIEHLIPSKATIRSREAGQSVWDVPTGNPGVKLTMVIQNVLKQGKSFNDYVNDYLSSIKKAGTNMKYRNLVKVNGLEICNYLYEMGQNIFIYTVVNGSNSFYFVGFVGNMNYEGELDKIHKTVYQSFKNSGTQLVQSAKTPANTNGSNAGIKQIVMDNRNNGYDFSAGTLRSARTSPDPDVINEPWSTALPGLGGNWAKTGKSRMEDVTSPPATGYISDGYDFINAAEAPLNNVLVFKLKNGKYAKFMIIKDEFSKSGSGCQHKITCLIQYPAF